MPIPVMGYMAAPMDPVRSLIVTALAVLGRRWDDQAMDAAADTFGDPSYVLGIDLPEDLAQPNVDKVDPAVGAREEGQSPDKST